MMGPRQEAQPALFYEFSLEDPVPQDHLLRPIDRFVDLSGIRAYLADFYSHTGGHLSILGCWFGCFWSAIASVSGRSGGSARKCI